MSQGVELSPDRELRRTIRDLVALATLPAAWMGREPGHIAAGLADLLTTAVRLDAVFVELSWLGGEPIRIGRWDGWPEFERWICEAGDLRQPSSRLPMHRATEIPASRGTLRVAVTPIGMAAEAGLVVAACRREDFPTELDSLLLSVAANQALISFQTARVMHERARTELELRKSEELFRSLSTCSPVGIFLTDTEGRCTYTNARCQEICGFTHEQALGEGWASFVSPQDRDRIFGHWSDTARRGADFAQDFRWGHDPASERWTHVRSAALISDEGRLLGHVGTVEDITDRKRADQVLRQSEQEFRALANSIPQLAWMAKPDGWIFWYNERWYEYTGTTPEQMEGWGWQSVHDPTILPTVLERWKQSISTRRPFEMQFPLRGADGVFRWFLTRVVPVHDGDGRLVRWFGTNTNVDEQRAAHVALQKSEERLHAALAASETGTFRWDPHTGNFLEFDGNLKRLFGLGPDEHMTVTEDFLRRVHPDDLPALLPAIEASRQGADFSMEYRVVLPDASIRWLYDRARMEWEDGRPAYLIGACTDITARKVAEAALLEAEKLASVGRLAATVAHEINNPLEAVTNYIYLAKNSANLPASASRHLEIADRELARVSYLAQQTLGFYRDTSEPAWVEVAGVIQDVLQIYERKLAYKGLGVSTEIDPHLRVFAAVGELKQAVSNILANAIDACRDGDKIRVRAYHAREWKNGEQPAIRITIADTGGGMSPEVARNIFTPFFTTKKEVGTGLGLWVTKNALSRVGGSIRFRTRNRAPSGTVMSICLPQHGEAKAYRRVS